jgi:outer membrane lipoprotein SlyB
MKTLINQIKILALATVLAFSMDANAQKEVTSHNIFVRVYNMEGKKISKGSIIFINDSLLGLKNSSEKGKISMKDIGFIKTKRSAGNNVLIGAASGATFGVIIGVSSADPDAWIFGYTAGEGAALFGSIGALGGGAIGGLSSLFKESETYIINGSEVNWNSFRKLIGAHRFK